LRGEAVTARAKNVHKQHGWVLSVERKSGEIFAEALIDRLIAMVPAGKLGELCRRYQGAIEVEISVIAHASVSESAPSISLNPSQGAFLAGCNGSFDVDLYLQ